MSYFDDASLVMIPSGYKDQKVYSVKPIDGSGDLTFSRASNATRVNSSGLVEKVRTNLLNYSNDFSNAAWGKSNATLTGGQSGYDGSTNGWKLEATAVSCYISQGTYSVLRNHSIYAKAGTFNLVSIIVGGYGQGVTFNLTTGAVVTNTSSALYSPVITSVGSGWYRISVGIQAAAPAYGMLIAPNDINGGTIAAGEFIYIQAAQTEYNDIATDYIATTTAAVSVGPVANVPRLDYLNSSCPRLLLEPQRTNSVTSSENIATGWTYTNTGISVNQTASPDGYANADAIVPDATSGQHAINSANITASGSFTLSAFVKAGEYTKVAIRESANTGSYASFNLATGTKIEDNVSGASFIQSYGNGWYRIGVTGTFSGTIRLGINVLSNAYTTGNPSSGTTFFSGNASDKLFCWGMQAELGATYATSYIPTLSSAVTRVADAASKTGISSLIGQTEGTLFVEVSALSGANEDRQISINDGTTSNRVTMALLNNGTQIQFVVQSGGSVVMNTTQTISGLTTGVKIAYAYKVNDFAVYVNGALLATDTNGAVPVSMSAFSFDAGNSGDKFFGKVSQALLFKTRLSNADLATLTTL